MQRFGSLQVGNKFYVPDKDGTIDLKNSLHLHKVSIINLIEPVDFKTTKVMKSVAENGNRFNAAVIGGWNGAFNGHYAFINNDDMVVLDRDGTI